MAAKQAEPPAVMRLSELWMGLSDGRLRAVDDFCDDAHCYVAIAPNQGRFRRSCLNPRNLQTLQRVMLGHSQKAIAHELGLASSSVSVTTSRCLRAMGLDCPAARAPLLLFMALHSALAQKRRVMANTCGFEEGGADCRVIWSRRPDGCLLKLLTRGQADVARLVVAGKSHSEIATLRRRSGRTISNQLCSAYQKLGVSGRVQLINYVVTY